MQGGTVRQKRKLVSSHGYSYDIKRQRESATYWVCTHRPKTNPCTASVNEREGEFIPGSRPHNHPAVAGLLTATKVIAAAKEKGMHDIFKPATAVVNSAMIEGLGEEPCEGLPRIPSLERAVNQKRQRCRPKDPTSLHFIIDEDHLTNNFLRADIRVHDRRHLVMVTDKYLRLLSNVKTWYIDGTVNLCYHPLKQLLIIKAFICNKTATNKRHWCFF